MCFIALAPRLHGFEPAQYTFGRVYEPSLVFKRLFKMVSVVRYSVS